MPAVVASEHQTPYRLHGAGRWANRAVDALVDAFVVVSEHDRQTQLAETDRPARKIVKIYNGVPQVANLRYLQDDAAEPRAIARLLSDADLRAQFGAAGRQRVERLFTVQTMSEAMLALYTRLL